MLREIEEPFSRLPHKNCLIFGCIYFQSQNIHKMYLILIVLTARTA